MAELNINPGFELRDPHHELRQFKVRLAVASAAVLILFGLLFGRFAYLQVAMHGHYHTLAEANRISIVPIPPNRGLVLDRNGIALAHNYSAYTLEITPTKVRNIEALIDELATLVEITPRDRRRFRKLLEESRRFESIPIRSRLTDEEIARFAANRYRFPGADVRARLFREYPQGEIFSHVIGHIGRISQRDVERLEREGRLSNYRGSDYIGKTGLEFSYEEHLHGTTGIERIEVDSAGRAVRSLSRTPPIVGKNLVLKLDARLQEVVYRAFGDRRGALVAIEPETGGVLAFVSKPGFDPNLFVDGIDQENWNELNNSPDRPMVNRALAGTYPPGSTFKPFMALAALVLGRRTPQQAIADPGYFMFGSHQFRDIRVGGHGMVNMYRSLVVSCNTYYYMLANEMGIDAIARFMAQFGFGSRTGIDLAGEAAGVLPSPEWKMRRFRQRWYAGETISVGIGQGYNAYTPLQLAAATATLVNDGVAFRPHVVNYVDDIHTRTRTFIEPKPARVLNINREHFAVIRHAMVGASREGTSARAFAGAPYTSGGKTGTSQVVGMRQGERSSSERHADHAMFIAYAPAERPTIALAVVVEHGGFGGRIAAPIARQVMDYWLIGKDERGPAREDEDAPHH
jgi:penicillin-binding protein 2